MATKVEQPTRTRNQRGEGDRLRTALLDAAGELLADARDVDELSVRAVTARAGVSPTALYLHFADKEELVAAVKASCFDALGAVLREAAAKHEGDPAAQLRAMGLAYLRFAREQPGRYAILFHTQNTPAQPRRKGRKPIVGLEVFELVVAAVARCRGDDADAFQIAVALWMALHGRALAVAALPGFPFPNEKRFVDLLAERLVG
jgi:AcrR family transcriptional regulator